MEMIHLSKAINHILQFKFGPNNTDEEKIIRFIIKYMQLVYDDFDEQKFDVKIENRGAYSGYSIISRNLYSYVKLFAVKKGKFTEDGKAFISGDMVFEFTSGYGKTHNAQKYFATVDGDLIDEYNEFSNRITEEYDFVFLAQDYEGFQAHNWREGDISVYERGVRGPAATFRFMNSEFECLNYSEVHYEMGMEEFETWLKEVREQNKEFEQA